MSAKYRKSDKLKRDLINSIMENNSFNEGEAESDNLDLEATTYNASRANNPDDRSTTNGMLIINATVSISQIFIVNRQTGNTVNDQYFYCIFILWYGIYYYIWIKEILSTVLTMAITTRISPLMMFLHSTIIQEKKSVLQFCNLLACD